MSDIQASVVLESGTGDCGGCGRCHRCTSPLPPLTQDVKEVPTVSTLKGSAYVLAIQDGELVKITIDNLKKIV